MCIRDRSGMVPGLTGLMTEAKKWVPASKQSATKVYMFATAGLRLLSATEATAVWTQVASTFQDKTICPFSFENAALQAKTITGATEGMYGWIAVNYATGQLQKAVTTSTGNISGVTNGVLDLGGASTQITFSSKVALPADRYPFMYERVEFPTMFAQTHMRSGVNEAKLRLLTALYNQAGSSPTSVTSPCHRANYTEAGYDISSYVPGVTNLTVVGAGNYTACNIFIREKLLYIDIWECTQKPCGVLGRYQPALPAAADAFNAFSNFYFGATGVGLMSFGSSWSGALSEFVSKAETFCAADGSTDISSGPFAKGNCFTASFALTLMVDGYKLSTSTSGLVTISDKVNGFDASWPLGAAIHASGGTTVLIEDYSSVLSALNQCESEGDDTPDWVWPVVGSLIGCVVVLLALVVFTKMKPSKAQAHDDSMDDIQMHSGNPAALPSMGGEKPLEQLKEDNQGDEMIVV
eukprot:TRINITY_DN50965_c0_g1_i2.p1 TRINITY_DN50965_c0_g1~~TRINITY_DN50965_c0_g1_i2.p1  ORF type:complete len:466 (+),score=97.62 TRINITY_DN50965_c0_g1_i2:68-1465(+)